MKRIFMRGNPGDFANYVAALTACGAEPVISMTLSDADTCDGLLIPGGADVNPVLYGQENTASEGIDDSRDADEIGACKMLFCSGQAGIRHLQRASGAERGIRRRPHSGCAGPAAPHGDKRDRRRHSHGTRAA